MSLTFALGAALVALAFVLTVWWRAGRVRARRRAAREEMKRGERAMMEAWRSTKGPTRLPAP